MNRNVILIIISTFFCCAVPLQAEEKVDFKRVEQQAVSLLRQILKDPMLPQSINQATLKLWSDPEFDKEITKDTSGLYLKKYALVPSVTHLDEASIWIKPSGEFNMSLWLTNQDAPEPVKEPDWDKLASQWDSFVTRYWPGLQRESDWRQAMMKYAPGRGVFNLQYALHEQGFVVASLTLDIRLADGKVGGLNFVDRRQKMQEVFKKHPAPPAPTQAAMLDAVIKAVSEHKVRQLPLPLSSPQIVENSRGYSRLIFAPTEKERTFGWGTTLKVIADAPKNELYLINAQYDEERQKAYIGTIDGPFEKKFLARDLPALRDTTGADVMVKPFTTVGDSQPVWSADGKHLYFTTTRDVQHRPWWQRGSVLFSIGRCDLGDFAQVPSEDVVLLRPIKPMGADQDGYVNGQPSPSGRYLAVVYHSSNRFFILDMQEGVVYLPDRTDVWATELLKHLPSKAYLVDPASWKTKGVAWLPGDVGLILSMPMTFPDADLILAKREKDKAPLHWDLQTLDEERADSIEPHLNHQATLAAYFEKLPSAPAQATQLAAKWRLVVADFDAAASKISNRRKLDLPTEPSSLSWDSKGERWLVVTAEGMSWVKEIAGKLQVTQVQNLKWGDIALHPTAATVAPQGDQIVVAADLAEPKVYEKTEVIVTATLFLWDGKSQQVQPLFTPSLNGLPRYKFSATNSNWARISGDTQNFGLQGAADSAFFLAETPANAR